jgi:hypothetical protein
MRTATVKALMLRDASQRSQSVETLVPLRAAMLLSMRTRRILAKRSQRGGKTNLRLQETIAGRAPLFPDCYLQWMAQLQRVGL